MNLPDFEKGSPVTAEQMAALANRVRALQARVGGCAVSRRHSKKIEADYFAFELRLLNGLIYFRRGWVNAGNGKLLPVGAQEWNAIGPIKPCTIWAEITEEGGEVKQEEYDVTTPELNCRRRLGYIREEKQQVEGREMVVFAVVQVLGGLLNPLAPRREMGCPTDGLTALKNHFGKGEGGHDYMHAGAVYGDGYVLDGEPQPFARVPFGYSVSMGEAQLPTEIGGNTLSLFMSFSCRIM